LDDKSTYKTSDEEEWITSLPGYHIGYCSSIFYLDCYLRRTFCLQKRRYDEIYDEMQKLWFSNSYSVRV